MTERPPYFTLLSHWQIETITGWEALQENVFRIDSQNDKTYVFKAIGEVTEMIAERLHFERDVLSHVVAAGVAAAVPLLTTDGLPYVIDDGKIYRLSRWLPNRYREPATAAERTQLYRNYGTAMARFHAALATYQDECLYERTWQTNLPKRIFDEALPVVRSHLDPAQAADFEAALESVMPLMQQSYPDLPRQLMIWDCHPGNVAVDGFAVSGFIDLDHLAIAPRVLDLADFLVHLVKWDLDDEEKVQQWIAFFPHLLDAYTAVNPLSPQERAALYPAMVAIPLIFMDFFYQNGHAQLTATELSLFHCLVEKREAIAKWID